MASLDPWASGFGPRGPRGFKVRDVGQCGEYALTSSCSGKIRGAVENGLRRDRTCWFVRSEREGSILACLHTPECSCRFETAQGL